MVGRDWSEYENEVAVDEYFGMLLRERAGLRYVKKRSIRRVRAQTGRTEGAVEYKFENVSAVLDNHGVQWIRGFKPAKNFQASLELIVLQQAEAVGLRSPTKEKTASSTSEAVVQRRAAMILRGRVREPSGQTSPNSVTTTTTAYERDPRVRAWVLRHARGECELCGAKAPFDRNDGTHYLETHHVVALGAGGPDTVDNVAALCPNCHRRLHHSADAADAMEELYRKVDRLRRH